MDEQPNRPGRASAPTKPATVRCGMPTATSTRSEARRPAGRQRRPAWGTSQIPESELQDPRRRGRQGHPRVRVRRGAVVDRAGAGGRAAGRARSLGAPARARPAADGRGGRRLPADPRQRRGRAAPRRVVRHRLLRPRGDDLRRPVSDGPEAARLLRPGGLFAFNHHSPIETICWALGAETVGDRLVIDYFGMHRFDDDDDVVLPAHVRRLDPAVPRERPRRRGPDRAATAGRRHEQLSQRATSWRGRGAGHRRRSGGCAESEPAGACQSRSTSRTSRSPGPCSSSSASRTRSRPRSSAPTGSRS